MNVPKLRFKEFSGEWIEKKLEDISSIKTGPFGSTLHQHDYVEFGTPIITVEHLGEQSVTHKNLPLVSDEDKYRLKSYTLREGDVVFSRVGSVDRSCFISTHENGWLFSGRLLRIRLSDDQFSSLFLNQIFKNETVKYRLRSVAVGQTMPSLNTEILKSFCLYFPPSLEEQTKIANFLSAVDDKIAELTEKVALLQRYKKGAMQQIFSQQLRFKDDNGQDFPEWEEIELGKMMKESRIIGDKGDIAKKITVKLWGKGVFAKDEKTLGSSNTQYYVRKAGQFIYSKLDFLNCAFGIIPKGLDNFQSTVDLPCFDIDECTHSIFLLELVKQKSFYENNGDKADGSRKAKRIHANDFLSMRAFFPCLPEQTKIANFLSALDEQINTSQQQLDLSKQYKQSLLQQMFV